MKLPRDVSGDDLAKRLNIFGYEVSRQVGSHLRLTTTQRGEHHVTVPRHDALKLARSLEFLGTLLSILALAGTKLSLRFSESDC